MQDVTIDRNLYIGGSDICAILGISKFKTRWELLQEKAGLKENDFTGNKYTEYGNVMEPKIRDYINKTYGYNFVETKTIDGYRRYHADGDDEKAAVLLEVKTTSDIHTTLEEYDYYLCQELYGMGLKGYDLGILAVYERPEDFDEELDQNRLQVFEVKFCEHFEFYQRIDSEAERFWKDREALIENPFLTEEDFQPKEVIEAANFVLNLEAQLTFFKQIEEESKAAKARLKTIMEDYGIKSWTTPNGTKITLVPDGESTVEEKFDEKTFKAENPELHAEYLKLSVKKGRSGYVRITHGNE